MKSLISFLVMLISVMMATMGGVLRTSAWMPKCRSWTIELVSLFREIATLPVLALRSSMYATRHYNTDVALAGNTNIRLSTLFESVLKTFIAGLTFDNYISEQPQRLNGASTIGQSRGMREAPMGAALFSF